jgi:hypothetical protein
MEKEEKYIYCIIGTKQERNFGPIGIGDRGDEVLTIGYDDLSMVVSNSPMAKYVVSRDNMLAHERVIEEVMKEFTVLPVRFCTIASSADEIRNLLDKRYKEFKNLLRDMDHKIELGVKGIWENMDVIFKEIVEENKEIKLVVSEANLKVKEKIQNEGNKIEVGKMVEQALVKKKEKETERLVDALRRTSVDYRLNKTITENMFMNAAFLVDKGREKEFDNIIDDLGDKYKNRIKFMYAGPMPPYNFINIAIYPEEWER